MNGGLFLGFEAETVARTDDAPAQLSHSLFAPYSFSRLQSHTRSADPPLSDWITEAATGPLRVAHELNQPLTAVIANTNAGLRRWKSG
jgi:hypothetical protein